jgi:hypothetical protein
MKRTTIIIFISVFAFSSNSQTGVTFQNAPNMGIEMKQLDNIYISGVNVDTSKAAFAGQENEFYKAWETMYKELAGFLKENGFKWEQPTRCFNKVYFSSDGSIDYFLYNFRSGNISEEKAMQFDQLLNQFIKTYKFGMSCKVKFSQCGPILYMDKE